MLNAILLRGIVGQRAGRFATAVLMASALTLNGCKVRSESTLKDDAPPASGSGSDVAVSAEAPPFAVPPGAAMLTPDFSAFVDANDAGATAADYQSHWKKSAALFASGVSDQFSSYPVMIKYHFFAKPGSNDHIVILPGLGEAAQKYAELICDFNTAGFNVHIMNHRGMGESGRLSPRGPQIIHIERFSDYYADAKRFVKIVQDTAGASGRLFLFAHSTGGMIGAHVLADMPDAFASAVLASPLFEVNTHGHWKATLAAWSATRPKDGFAPTFGEWTPVGAKFTGQTTTHSVSRWWTYNEVLKKNMELVVGGPSNGWVWEALNATKPALVKELASKIKTPTLVVQGGEDTWVGLDGEDRFVAACGAMCAKIRFDGSRHETYNEVEAIRAPFLAKVVAQFQPDGGAGSPPQGGSAEQPPPP